MIEWDEVDLRELVVRAQLQGEASASFLSKVSKYTTLLPEQHTLTVAWLKANIPKNEKDEVSNVYSVERRVFLDVVSAGPPGKDWEAACLELWPVRAKSDLSLRRTRMADIWFSYKFSVGLDRWRSIVAELAGFDYISVMNICLASLLLCRDGFSWWEVWRSFGAFSAGVSYYGVCAKFVNDQVKRHAHVDFPRGFMAECGVMTGYRNPPFPGFDVFEQASDLANAGTLHGLERSELAPEWVRQANESLRVAPAPVTWTSLRDYVLKAGWLTSGASSDGRVEWAWGDEKGHFKARKNLVPEVVDLNELADRVEAANSQVNVTIIKAELGKIRLAVSSDLEMYLKMDYLMYFLNHAYKAWPGNTIEESVKEQAYRQNAMYDAIIDNWNLPFDYAGFDHQASTKELQFMMASLAGQCLSAIDPRHHAEFMKVSTDVVNSFSHSVLKARNNEEEREFVVTGGLMSGLRVTTLAGNAWNTVMTGLVEKYLRILGLPAWTERWIRGDDSAIVKRTYVETLLFRLLYAAINADGADGKFGIHFGCSEFLRVWYERDGLMGYASRAIPGLTQRKPWSPNPWSDEAVMTQVYDATCTLRRRGVASKTVGAFWRSVKTGWSRRKHVSTRWLSIPAPRGLGVEPWDGFTVVDRPWPRTKMDGFELTNGTGWTKRQLLEQYASWMPVSDSEADQMAKAAISSKIAGDDVPQINSALRGKSVVPTEAVFSNLRAPAPNGLRQLAEAQQLRLRQLKRRALERWTPEVGDYGSYSWLRQKWVDVSAVLRYRGGSTLTYFRSLCPEFVHHVLNLERKGLARSEALDWLFGSVSWNRVDKLHSMLSSVLTTSVCEVMAKARGAFNVRGVWRSWGARLCSIFERSLVVSELSSVMFSW